MKQTYREGLVKKPMMVVSESQKWYTLPLVIVQKCLKWALRQDLLLTVTSFPSWAFTKELASFYVLVINLPRWSRKNLILATRGFCLSEIVVVVVDCKIFWSLPLRMGPCAFWAGTRPTLVPVHRELLLWTLRSPLQSFSSYLEILIALIPW